MKGYSKVLKSIDNFKRENKLTNKEVVKELSKIVSFYRRRDKNE